MRGQSHSDDAALPKACHFSSFSAMFGHFFLSWLRMPGFEGDNQVKSLIFQATKEMPRLVKIRGQSVSDEIAFPRYGIIPYFQSLLPLSNKKWLILSVILKFTVLNISIRNRGKPTLVKLRGPISF